MIREADSSISIDIPATNYTIASYNLNKKYDALDHLLELGALQKMNFLCLQELPIKRTISIPQGYSIASLKPEDTSPENPQKKSSKEPENPQKNQKSQKSQEKNASGKNSKTTKNNRKRELPALVTLDNYSYTAILVNKDILQSHIVQVIHQDKFSTTIKVTSKHDEWHVSSIYNHAQRGIDFHSFKVHEHHIIAGDFNIHEPLADNRQTKMFIQQNFMSETIIKGHTTIYNTNIDRVLAT